MRLPSYSIVLSWLRSIELEHLMYYDKELIMDPPSWVSICFLTANSFGHAAPAQGWRGTRWREFMLALAKDRKTQEAIDSTVRLDGNRDQLLREVGELYLEFYRKMNDTPVIDKLRKRHTLRTRRMTGQVPSGRPDDRTFWKESLPPKVRRTK